MSSFDDILETEILREEHEENLADAMDDSMDVFIDDEIEDELLDTVIDDDDESEDDPINGTMFSIYDTM